MFIELVVFVAVIILALIFIAQLTRAIAIGLIAGAMFLILAAWIYGMPGNAGIQMNMGQNITTSSYENNNLTQTNQTITPIYVDVPTTPYISMENILAFIFLLSGLSTILYYSIEVMQGKQE